LTIDIADGIYWAAGGSILGIPDNKNPAQIINLSLGSLSGCGSYTQLAIDFARNSGATVITAAGNSNNRSDANQIFPGNCAGVINVAATDINDGLAFYSNIGTVVDVSAPGGITLTAAGPSGILSTTNSGTTDPVADSYGYKQGTSFAAPHVAGVAALLYQAQPGITPDEVEILLKNNTRPLSDGCPLFLCGAGIVDATAVVNAALANNHDEVLVNGRPKAGLSASSGKSIFFTFEVPENAVSLLFKLKSNKRGDADLYIRHASRPTKSSYDCRPYKNGSNEVCRLTNPQPGTWHVMIDAFSDYSDVSLMARYVSAPKKLKNLSALQR